MKKNKITALLLAFLMLISVNVLAEETATDTQTPEEQVEKVEKYSNYMIKSMIRYYSHYFADNYYYGVNDDELLFSVIMSGVDEGKIDVNKSLEAMIKTLKDDYAEFYTPEAYKAMTEDIAGSFSGIGVTIRDHENGVLILSVNEGGGAYKAGIMPYDHIIGVDGKDVRELTSAQVRELIVGETGTSVKIKILRGKEELEVTCIRENVTVSQLETEMINDKTAYMRLLQFTSNSSEEVQGFVDELKEKKVQNVILDLRDNPGGDLQAAIAIANIFISRGKIGQLRYKNEDLNEFVYSENYNAPNFNMAVLINEHSASASEFLAMAFQSRNAAKIIGTKSYGKGSMQILNRAATGAGFKFTIGEFYSWKGKRIHTVGITPDMLVENTITPVDESAFAKIDYDKILAGNLDGETILALEQRLVALGYMREADEIFDETTKDAVSRFQAIVGYEVTGEPTFYDYMFLNDYDYEPLTIETDDQKQTAVDYLSK